MTEPEYITAHKSSSRHRDQILRSKICGCFCCLHTFTPTEIKDWIDEHGGGQTAMCPQCGTDSVIGSDSGYPITRDFLSAMQAHWFAASKDDSTIQRFNDSTIQRLDDLTT